MLANEKVIKTKKLWNLNFKKNILDQVKSKLGFHTAAEELRVSMHVYHYTFVTHLYVFSRSIGYLACWLQSLKNVDNFVTPTLQIWNIQMDENKTLIIPLLNCTKMLASLFQNWTICDSICYILIHSCRQWAWPFSEVFLSDVFATQEQGVHDMHCCHPTLSFALWDRHKSMILPDKLSQ